MMISKKRKSKSLSDKLCEALKAPDLQDPEDDIYEDTKAKTVEADSDFENDEHLETFLSSFRKQNAKLLEDVDKKYAGRAVSRKDLYSQSEEEESNEESGISEADNSEGLLAKQRISATTSDDLVTDDEGNLNDDFDDQDKSLQKSSDYDSEDESVISEEDHEGFEDESEASEEDDDGSEDEDDFDMGDDLDISKNVDNKRKEKSSFKHVSEASSSEAVQKGNAVRQQLHIWEKLMEMRIHTQKVLLHSNKLPKFDEYSDFIAKTNPEFKDKIQESEKLLANLLNKLLDVQNLLLNKYPETKNLLTHENIKKTDDMDEEIPSDTEEESEKEFDDDRPLKKRKISEIPSIISEIHDKYTTYRNDVIQKWHDKVRVSSGVMNHKNSGTNSLLQHIQYVLLDKDRLRRRTQLKRSNYKVLTLKPETEEIDKINENKEQSNNIEVQKIDDNEYDPEIFDDDDFYHQLLRELIEYKTANVTDPVQLSKQWIELQQLRNKMKRKIDTKATKGRRIRYSVHPKLVNFMAAEDNGLWTDEAKDELFGSLFGQKIKQTNSVNI